MSGDDVNGNDKSSDETKTKLGDNNLETKSNENPGVDSSIDSIKIKLPPFWSNNPQIWFYQAEAQFNIYKISSDSTKYFLIISVLPPNISDNIIDILSNPPKENKYVMLKNALLERRSLSEEKRLEKLLEREDLRDKKPSDAYRSMQILAGSGVSEKIITNLWFRRLPQIVNITLISVGDKPINELLSLADKIYEASRCNLYI